MPCKPYRPGVARSSSESAALVATVGELVAVIDAAKTPDAAALRDAVRGLLTVLRQRAPGRSVEVRVPPFGAVQCVPGPAHTRGTPPNVVEMDPPTWLAIATGRAGWAATVTEGRIRVSGIRADLSPYLPI